MDAINLLNKTRADHLNKVKLINIAQGAIVTAKARYVLKVLTHAKTMLVIPETTFKRTVIIDRYVPTFKQIMGHANQTKDIYSYGFRGFTSLMCNYNKEKNVWVLKLEGCYGGEAYVIQSIRRYLTNQTHVDKRKPNDQYHVGEYTFRSKMSRPLPLSWIDHCIKQYYKKNPTCYICKFTYNTHPDKLVLIIDGYEKCRNHKEADLGVLFEAVVKQVKLIQILEAQQRSIENKKRIDESLKVLEQLVAP